MIVMKFGGSSLANADQLTKVYEIVESRKDRRPVVVCSAHKGVTDLLIRAAKDALAGEPDASGVVERQRSVLNGIGADPWMLDHFFKELEDLLRGISLVQEASPRVMDYVQSFGERMSVRAVAFHFIRQGLKAEAFDAFDLGFVTDDNFGTARPVEDFESRMKKAFEEKVADDVVPIITGFVGKTTTGIITTVGRNGSDFTASCFAAGLGADECQIWTDTNGVMTADPSLVDRAQSIPHMSFAEASELAYYGGRVLHPATLLPAVKRNVPVRVLNTNAPDHPGTVITSEGGEAINPITSIAYKEKQSVVTIESARMLMQHGFLLKIFEVLAAEEVSVDMISTSEISVSMTTSATGEKLERVVERLAEYGRVRVANDKSLVCIVGRELQGQMGLAAQVFGALRDDGVNVEMISHGANNINLSFVIDDGQIDATVRSLHGALFD